MTPDVLLTRKLMSRQNLTRAESAELVEDLLRHDREGWKPPVFVSRELGNLVGFGRATSVVGPSRLRGFRNGEDFDFVLQPGDCGLSQAPKHAVMPVDADSNFRDFLRIAHGLETGPKRDLVALNAGLALWISDRAATIEDGIQTSIQRLESGSVAGKLTTLVEQHGEPEILRQARALYLST